MLYFLDVILLLNVLKIICYCPDLEVIFNHMLKLFLC